MSLVLFTSFNKATRTFKNTYVADIMYPSGCTDLVSGCLHCSVPLLPTTAQTHEGTQASRALHGVLSTIGTPKTHAEWFHARLPILISGKRSEAKKTPDPSGFCPHHLITSYPVPNRDPGPEPNMRGKISPGALRACRVFPHIPVLLSFLSPFPSFSLFPSLSFSEISFLMVWNETHYSQLTCCEPTVLAGLPIIIHP